MLSAKHTVRTMKTGGTQMTATISINDLRKIDQTPAAKQLAQSAANGSAEAVKELKKLI